MHISLLNSTQYFTIIIVLNGNVQNNHIDFKHSKKTPMNISLKKYWARQYGKWAGTERHLSLSFYVLLHLFFPSLY